MPPISKAGHCGVFAAGCKRSREEAVGCVPRRGKRRPAGCAISQRPVCRGFASSRSYAGSFSGTGGGGRENSRTGGGSPPRGGGRFCSLGGGGAGGRGAHPP